MKILLISCPDYAEYKGAGKGMTSFARLTPDGRITVSLKLPKKLPDLPKDYASNVEEFGVDETHWKECPPLNIVIMIVGSRGMLDLTLEGYFDTNLIIQAMSSHMLLSGSDSRKMVIESALRRMIRFSPSLKRMALSSSPSVEIPTI